MSYQFSLRLIYFKIVQRLPFNLSLQARTNQSFLSDLAYYVFSPIQIIIVSWYLTHCTKNARIRVVTDPYSLTWQIRSSSKNRAAWYFTIICKHINPFPTNVPLLYLLTTSENRDFSDVFRGYRNGTFDENRSSVFTELVAIRNLNSVTFCSA